MDAVGTFFGDNMVLVFFVYGLAWFLMGVAIVLTTQRSLRLTLSDTLPWLAAFGLIHAAADWLDMLNLMTPHEGLLANKDGWLRIGKIALQGLSAIVLLHFGLRLALRPRIKPALPYLLSLVALVLWLASPVYVSFLAGSTTTNGTSGPALATTPPTMGTLERASRGACTSCHASTPVAEVPATPTRTSGAAILEVFARYLLLLPGMVLSAIGLYRQGRAFRKQGLPKLTTDSNWAAAVFALNGLFSGLVVAPAPYFPASLLNYHTFLTSVAVPPQVFRAAAAIASMFFILRILRVFRIEYERRLAEATRDQLRAQQDLSRELATQVSGLSKELTELHSFGERIAAGTDSSKVLSGLTSAITTLLQADGCTVYLRAPDGQLAVASTFGICQPDRQFPATKEAVAAAASSGHTVALQDVPLECDADGLLHGVGAVLAVPLQSRAELLGVVSVQARLPREFGEADRNLLETIAGQAAIALHNARLYAQVSAQSILDSLTGLYNHRYFQERLDEEIRRAAQTNAPLSLLFCDLDHFKGFNDANGHPLGDRALRDVATIIGASRRPTDVAARYGGEEFVVILSGVDTAAAVVVAERIRREIAGHAFETRNSVPFPLTISVGIASFPRDARSKAELIDKADWAMYNAKRKGRNQTRTFAVETDYAKPPAHEDGWPEDLYLSTVYALAAAVDARDHYTRRHSEIVALYASATAQELGLAEDEVDDIRVAALLHDVGKIGIRDAILNKVGALTDAEWAVVAEHPQLGADILGHVRSMLRVVDYVRHHHERYDGKGYPDGLSGENIPLGARIIAVPDAFHAMTSDRPYRPARSAESAVEELEACAGRQFDPEVVRAFLVVAEKERTGVPAAISG